MAKEKPEEQPPRGRTTEPESPESTEKKVAIPRVKKKIPEPADNLRRREEWLRNRTGA